MLQFDHVALGVADAAPVAARLVEEFGGTVLGGGIPPGSGFQTMQVHLGSPEDLGMTVELLQPHAAEENDFLQRFIERHGDGPHHMTFKTPDIRAEIARLQDMGIEPVGVRLSNPDWQELFIHPKTAHGVVIQIAQSGDGLRDPVEVITERRAQGYHVFEGRTWWGTPERGPSVASLRRVMLGSIDPQSTIDFYVDVMGGSHVGSGVIRWTGGELVVRKSDRSGIASLELDGLFASQTIAGTEFLFG